MRIRLKFWFMRHYWWLLLVALFLLAIIIIQQGQHLELLLPLLGTVLSLIFFLQKQRLEELKLFRDIFANCNSRYDNLNEKLNAIVDEAPEKPLTPEHPRKKIRYLTTLTSVARNTCILAKAISIQRFGGLGVTAWNTFSKIGGSERFGASEKMKEKEGDSYYGLPL